MPEGFKGLPNGKDRERHGCVEFIGQDWKGGKSRRAKGALPEWNWRGLMKNRGSLGNAGVGYEEVGVKKVNALGEAIIR